MANAKENTIWQIGDLELPVEILRERRSNARIAFAKNGLIVRLPVLMTAADARNQIQKFKLWASETIQSNPALSTKYTPRTYPSAFNLKVGKFDYSVTIEPATTQQHYGKIKDTHIHLSILMSASATDRVKAIQHLLSRLVAKHQLPWIKQRVAEINQTYFQQPVTDVKLRYSTTRWGSCSSRGSLNFSTRLLFAQASVIDYVIIHELAHRLEMNHSPKFWAHVARVMPEYKRCEDWLKKHGGTCNF